MDSPVEKIFQTQNNGNGGTTIYLEPINETFQPKRITLIEGSYLKIGRMTNKGTTPSETNGYFDSKVLSRNHAEISYFNNQIFIKDLKSSNGTFINGKRLSAEGKESSPVELRNGDDLEFGVDIINEPDKKLLYRKVAAKVHFSMNEIYDGGVTNGIDSHQKIITNGHMSSGKRRSTRVPSNTENSLLSMLETELDRARADSRCLSDIGCMLNDATNTLDGRKRAPLSEKTIDFRFHDDSTRFEETQFKLKETEAKLNEAIISQKDYKEKFLLSDKRVNELKDKYIASVIELEQKCTCYEKKIFELEQKYQESNQRAIEFEKNFKNSESNIQILEDTLKNSSININNINNHINNNHNNNHNHNNHNNNINNNNINNNINNSKLLSNQYQFKDLEERLSKLTNELSETQYFLDDTREQLKRTERELNTSQKKCREFQVYATKYNDAMKTIEELRSVGESFGNRFENRDEAIEKFDEERITLSCRVQYLEDIAKKNDAESANLRDQLKKIDSLNKSLNDELEKERERTKSIQDQLEKVKEVRRLNATQEGLWRRHKKQESEPVKECEMTNERGLPESIIPNDKNFNFEFDSFLIKGSIGMVVLGIGAWFILEYAKK